MNAGEDGDSLGNKVILWCVDRSTLGFNRERGGNVSWLSLTSDCDRRLFIKDFFSLLVVLDAFVCTINFNYLQSRIFQGQL